MSQILFGKNSIIEAIKASRRRIHQVYLSGVKGCAYDQELERFIRQSKIPIKICDKKEIQGMVGSFKHQGVAAKVDDYSYCPLEQLIQAHPQKALFLMCDSVQDPQNFGTLCRSAWCFGVHGIILANDRSVDITPTVVSASAGAIEHLSVAKVVNLSRALGELKEKGFWVYGADGKATQSLQDLSPSPKMVIVMGSEGEGIRPLVLKNCDVTFKIPMVRDFDSLNVAQAGSIILYEMTR